MSYKEKCSITEAWEAYENGRNYNHMLLPDQYELVNTNTEFYAGNQWLHLPQTKASAKLPKPVFNIIKRITNVQVASLMSSGISVNLEPLSYYDASSVENPDSNACEFAQAEIENLFEKLKLEYKARRALFDGAISGDYCAHFYFDPTSRPYGGRLGTHVRGEIKMELVDGINVMFGDPNNADVQEQPYVLIVGRDTVDNLNAEAELYKKRDAWEKVVADSDRREQAGIGGQIELNTKGGNEKATFIYLYRKITKKVKMTDREGNPIMEPVTTQSGDYVYEKSKDGKKILDTYGMPILKLKQKYDYVTTVHVSKCTRTVEIFKDIDTGLSNYPIAWANWERQKNQYHGRALVSGVIQNQIYINSTFALVMRHMQLQAFPKRVYNADVIPRFNNEIGVDIGVHGLQPGMPINQVATTLQGTDFSQQILYTVDKAMEYTKECMGATDAQLGSGKIETTSLFLAMETSSKTPLENVRANFNEWIEDIVTILLDMMATYYGKRPIVRERSFDEPIMDAATGMPMLGQYNGQMQVKSVNRRVIEEFDFDELKHLEFCCRIDVGAGTVYSQSAMLQTLDKLREGGVLDLIDYLERVPDTIIPRRQELIQKLKAAQAQQNSGAPAGAALPSEGMGQGGNSEIHSILQQMNPDRLKKGRKPTDAPLTADDAINALPVNVKDQFDKLPPRAKGEVAKVASSRLQ